MLAKKSQNKRRDNKTKGQDDKFAGRIRQKPACRFCKESRIPSYKEWEGIAGLTTDRGKIMARERSGVCAKHQRQLTRAIKRARHLALLPFMVRAE